MKTNNNTQVSNSKYWLKIGNGSYGPFSDKITALHVWQNMPDKVKDKLTYVALFIGNDSYPDKLVYPIR